MKQKLRHFIKSFIANLLFFSITFAQSGGAFQITQSVTATGETISGGSFAIENTVGQPLAGGFPQADSYSVYSGFWTPPNTVPTAATVTIGGRITTANGQGIINVAVTLTDSNGAIRTAKTASFGYFYFDDVRVGETYILSISSKRFTFSSPTKILNVFEAMSDIDFIAEN